MPIFEHVHSGKEMKHPGVVEMKTEKLLYEVLIGGQMKWKHADQLCSRSVAMEDKPTAPVVNQQQEV
ncbi:hypothetical protein J437_LFUL018904 [Ladona fulva]|uniref:Uncharacterized protein n=1 Tax=Ladona fulva TaxID=123851 RepID=A0A8K0KR79_LADFU|nr:hypothetical protein J437_LFUL018904 [Ladona fulva]